MDIIEPPKPLGRRKKYATKEEAYEAHKQRVMAWQKANKEKVDVYKEKYESKEETIAMRKAKYEERWENMPPEEKKAVRERMCEYNKKHYHLDVEKSRSLSKARYEANREEILARQREAWQALSPEERKAIGRKHYLRRKEREALKRGDQDEHL